MGLGKPPSNMLWPFVARQDAMSGESIVLDDERPRQLYGGRVLHGELREDQYAFFQVRCVWSRVCMWGCAYVCAGLWLHALGVWFEL
jgi:hypothetical protein